MYFDYFFICLLLQYFYNSRIPKMKANIKAKNSDNNNNNNNNDNNNKSKYIQIQVQYNSCCMEPAKD